MQSNICLNCNHPLATGYKYCPQCGQGAVVHRLGLHEIGHDVVHYVTHADKSIFSLLGQLARRPGLVACEYVEGKRQKYFKPLNFFLIVAGLVVFMTSGFYTPNNARSKRMEQTAQTIQDPARRQQMLNMAHRSRQVAEITGRYSNVINMVATPLLAFICWLAYRRRYNYVETLVANMYFVGFTMLLYALSIVPLQHLVPRLGFYLLLLFFLFEIWYRGRAYRHWVNATGGAQVAKAYGVSLLMTLFWVATTFLLIAAYIRSGF